MTLPPIITTILSAFILIGLVAMVLLPRAQHYIGRFGGEKNVVNFFQWSFDELNVPPYPETRIYKAIARDLCLKGEHDRDVELIVDGKPTLFNRGTQKTYYCSDL